MRPGTLKRVVVALIVLAIAATACGDDDGEAAATTTAVTSSSTMDMTSSTMGDMGNDDHPFEWGTAGDPANADQIIEIAASDAFRFDPESVEVHVGETVTFRVTNEGAIRHEFVVGTPAEQDDHEAEMADMGSMPMADETNAIGIDPGETKDLTLTFTQAGALRFACHVTGHFAAGMVGALNVQS